ncbi:MAG: acetamidase/formamidase family protein [Cyanobacteria bacterium J06621_8]
MKFTRLPLYAQYLLSIAGLLILFLINNTLSDHPQLTTKVNSDYLVKSTIENVIWGRLFTANDEPILQIKSGDVVTIETISHEGIMPDQGDTVEFFNAAGIEAADILPDQLAVKSQIERTAPGPHVVTGPVYINDAEPGDVLEIKTINIDYRVPYGVISNRHGKGALPEEYPLNDADIYTKVIPLDTEHNIGIFRPANGRPDIALPLEPFMGIMGVAPADPEAAINSIPPGNYGGNIDIKHLTVGSSLYLPVQVPGALFYAGDPHCAQGNGEVALTAIECSLTPTFELIVHKNYPLESPMGETTDAWLAIGLDRDLDEAMKQAVRESLRIMDEEYGMTKEDALLFGSAAIDYEVSQVVDIVKGIHGVIPKDLLRSLEPEAENQASVCACLDLLLEKLKALTK